MKLTKRFKGFVGSVILFWLFELLQGYLFNSHTYDTGFELLVMAFISTWLWEELPE